MSVVDKFTSKFTHDRLDNVMKIKKDYFQVSDELMKVKQRIDKDPFAIGTFLGSEKPFHPSMALLEWLDKRTEKYVIADKKSAWLFVCGRDIFEESVVDITVSNGFTLVKNKAGEVLGYGDFINKRLKGKKVAVKNLLDRGHFLRK